MKLRIGLLAALLLTAALATFGQSGPLARKAQLDGCKAAVQGAVTQALEGQTEVPVIISLQGADGSQGPPSVEEMQQNTAQRQAAVLAALTESDFTLTLQYGTVSALTGLVTESGVGKLACHQDVVAVGFDEFVYATLAESVPLIHADTVQLAGLDGTNVDVAVLDTGVQFDHPDIADSFIGEECAIRALSYCSDVASDPPQPCYHPDHPANDCDGHGTHVAGIITSDGDNGLSPAGVAPGAGVFAYKVLTDAGWGSFGWVLNALDLILDRNADHLEEDIELVNMSLSGDNYSDPQVCDDLFPVITRAIEDLREQGTLIVAASGNTESKSTIGYPACIPAVVSVGATYDADIGPRSWVYDSCTDATTAPDKVACFSNSSDALDLLAPGSEIFSAMPMFFESGFCSGQPGQGADNCSGTSMAAPHAVAVAALMLDGRPGLSPDELVSRLKLSGKFVTDDFNDGDPATGRTTPRIDARAALLTDDGADFDLDGCTNGQELQDDLGSEPTGGLRNPLNFWDFFDVPAGTPPTRDKVVSAGDLFAVVGRFGSFGDPGGDPLSPPPPAPAYHTAYDRGGTDGPNNWNLLPADGVVSAGDISAVVAQFGHSCA